MSLNPYGKFWSSVQKFSTAIEFCARAYEISLGISAIFPVLSNIVPALFISFDLKCPVRFSLKMQIFVVPFSVAYVNIPSVIKKYTSKGGETGTKHHIVERCVFNRTMAAYSIFKFKT